MEKQKNLSLDLSKKAKNLLIGSLLGDCCIEKNRNFYRVRFRHSIKQENYLKYKHKILEPYNLTIRTLKIKDKRTGKIYIQVGFDTRSTSVFSLYQNLFYKENVKIVLSSMEFLLRSVYRLAIWYLDDGFLKTKDKTFRLYTDSFSLSEVYFLKAVLLKNFNIVCSIHRRKVSGKISYYLFIGRKGGMADKFNTMLKPLVAFEVPHMLYKFF